MAKSCADFEDWSIENLLSSHPDLLAQFTGPMSVAGAIQMFKLEGGANKLEVEQAKRCLLRLWHPDVNSEHREIATQLSQAINKATDILLRRSSPDTDTVDFSEPWREEPIGHNIFEEVSIHTFKGERDQQRFADNYADMSGVPFQNAGKDDGDHTLNVQFDTGNELHARWGKSGGGIWATGNFSTLEDRNHTNLWGFSLKGSAETLARKIMDLATAGVDVVGFTGSPTFYNRVRQSLEGMANDLLICASSMGSVDWHSIAGNVNSLDLNILADLLGLSQQAIDAIFAKYRAAYGEKLSNRKMPWGRQYSEYRLRESYPMLSTLEYFPTWVRRLQANEQLAFDEGELRVRLVEKLRRQFEDAEKDFPISNPKNDAYKIVSAFYAELDAEIKSIIDVLL